jgi:hypothetical protein
MTTRKARAKRRSKGKSKNKSKTKCGGLRSAQNDKQKKRQEQQQMQMQSGATAQWLEDGYIPSIAEGVMDGAPELLWLPEGTRTTADPYDNKKRQRQQQIPFGDDNQKNILEGSKKQFNANKKNNAKAVVLWKPKCAKRE